MIFKQLLQGDTCGGEHSKLDPNELPPIQFCQIDSCRYEKYCSLRVCFSIMVQSCPALFESSETSCSVRIAGVSEILSVLLIAAKYKIKVCPHAGGVGASANKCV